MLHVVHRRIPHEDETDGLQTLVSELQSFLEPSIAA